MKSNQTETMSAPGQDRFADEKKNKAKKREPTLEKAVQSLSESDAKALLLQYARKNAEIAEQIMLKTNGRVTDGQIQALLKEVSKITAKYRDRYNYIDYEYAGYYVDALGTFLEKEIPALLDSGLPMKAFELTCKVIQEASEVEMDDSDGEVETIYFICEDYWRDFMTQMNRAEQNQVFDWIQDNYTRWDGSDMFFNPFLFGDSTYESAFQGENFERRKLDFLDARLATAREGSYEMRTWAVFRLQTMAKLSMDAEEIERFARSHYQEQTVREWMIERAVQNGRDEEAISILRDSKRMDEKLMGCAGKYSAKLVELYGKLGRTEDLREELMFQMEQVRQSDLRYVNQIKEMTPPEEWPELREKLLSLRNLSGIRNQLLAQEELDELKKGGF